MFTLAFASSQSWEHCYESSIWISEGYEALPLGFTAFGYYTHTTYDIEETYNERICIMIHKIRAEQLRSLLHEILSSRTRLPGLLIMDSFTGRTHGA